MAKSRVYSLAVYGPLRLESVWFFNTSIIIYKWTLLFGWFFSWLHNWLHPKIEIVPFNNFYHLGSTQIIFSSIQNILTQTISGFLFFNKLPIYDLQFVARGKFFYENQWGRMQWQLGPCEQITPQQRENKLRPCVNHSISEMKSLKVQNKNTISRTTLT